MRFKEWLLSEAVDDDSWWDLIYPSKAGDYPRDKPREHWYFQWKLKRGEEIGRPVYNIDNPEFQARGYTSIESRSAPPATGGFWQHKPDDNAKGDLEPVYVDSLKILGVSKHADHPMVIAQEIS